MEIVGTINRAKYDTFKWRYELTIPKKLVLSLGMAALIGILAQVKFYLPWSPIPITGQTFAVLLVGVLLGRWWGGVSLVIYAGLGAVGLPWFAGLNGGLAYLAGPTGGYIVGFILATLFVGYFTDKYVRSRSFVSMFTIMLVANFILIYIPGLVQLHFWLNLVKREAVAFYPLLMMGAIPFIAGDVIKAAAAAAIARGITPKRAYGREMDKDKWANWRLP